MKMLCKNLCGGLLAVAASLILLSQAWAETTLKFVPFSDLQVLDPVWTTAGETKTHGFLIYDTLFGEDENGIVQPQMVDKYELSSDKLTYTFTLREGLKWHDGKPVTAEDCVASLKRWAARDGTAKVLMKRAKEIRVVDRSTFQIELSKPFGAAIDVLGRSSSRIPFMMPKRIAETDPKEQIAEFIGSGPFIFAEDEWVPGNKVVYKKNTEYVPRNEPPSGTAGGKVVNVDRVEWQILSDKQTAMQAILAGEIDIWQGIPEDLMPILKADPNVSLPITQKSGWFAYLVPNHRHAPFNNPKAREAMAWLIDQTTYLHAMVGNPDVYDECASMFTCGLGMSTDVNNEAVVGQDLDKARSLFKEAGWDFSTPIVLLDPSDDTEIHAAILVTAQALRSIGLKADVQVMDWATLVKRRAITKPASDGGWNIFVTYGSGISKQNPFFHSGYSGVCDDSWWSGACDDELEKSRDKWAMSETVEDKKKAAFEYQQRAFTVFSPWIPLGRWSQPIAVRNNVTGVHPTGTYLVFWNLKKQQ